MPLLANGHTTLVASECSESQPPVLGKTKVKKGTAQWRLPNTPTTATYCAQAPKFKDRPRKKKTDRDSPHDLLLQAMSKSGGNSPITSQLLQEYSGESSTRGRSPQSHSKQPVAGTLHGNCSVIIWCAVPSQTWRRP